MAECSTCDRGGAVEDIVEDRTLKNTFDLGMQLYERVDTANEPTNSSAMQLSVRQAIEKFESATRQVSQLGLFSSNESVDELSTETLQYLLLPALLGTLTLKICDQPRRELIDLAEIYFRDFLQRSKDYGIIDIELPRQTSSDEQEISTVPSRNQTEQQKLTAMVLSREAKIQRYKEQKELKDKLSKLKNSMESNLIDERTRRDYFTTLLLDYVNQCLEELSSIAQEKPILDYVAKHGGEAKAKPAPKSKPLKPIIITRDSVQKAVFGLGYPSIPAMTIEEFYDKRVKEGTFPGPANAANIPHANITNADNDEEELDKIQRELLRDEDDPEELARQRTMDEFKDEHRRGEGNRYNRS